jgi:hypothetical protein
MVQQIQLTQLYRHLDGLNRQSERLEIVENRRVLAELVGINHFRGGTTVTSRVPISRFRSHVRPFIISSPRIKFVYRNGEAIAVLITHKQDKEQ